MIFHRYYTDIPQAELDRFVQAQELGRLVTVGADGTPHIGLYPFVYDGTGVDVHLVSEDEQTRDLLAHPTCVFEVDEVLGVIPSYWVNKENGGAATAYHRTVIFECTASVVTDPERLAAQQARLLERYQPEGGYRPLDASDTIYRGMLRMLSAVRLDIRAVRPKFKLGQNRPPETRRAIAAELRRRGRPSDARAADALEWTLSAAAAVDGSV